MTTTQERRRRCLKAKQTKENKKSDSEHSLILKIEIQNLNLDTLNQDSIIQSWPIMSHQILPVIKSEKCQTTYGFNNFEAGVSSVYHQSLIMVRLKLRVPCRCDFSLLFGQML